MTHRYSTALSHLVLAGTGAYCLSSYGFQDLKFPVASYGLILANSVIGIWRYGNPDYGYNIDKPYRFTYFLQTVFVVPCVAAQIWLNRGYQPIELAYVLAGIPLLPLTAYLASRERRDIVDAIIALNILSMGTISFLETKYFGVAAAVSFFINYFIIRDEGEFLDDVPSQDLFNYGMCFAAYFALRALGEQ